MPVEPCQYGVGETLETRNYRITGLLWQQEKHANDFEVCKVNFQFQVSAYAAPYRAVGVAMRRKFPAKLNLNFSPLAWSYGKKNAQRKPVNLSQNKRFE